MNLVIQALLSLCTGAAVSLCGATWQLAEDLSCLILRLQIKNRLQSNQVCSKWLNGASVNHRSDLIRLWKLIM